MYKIAFIVGTRPDIIKMSPLIKEAIKRKLEFILIHSGQHYSENMDNIFFKQLNLPMPNFRINIINSLKSRGHIKEMQNQFKALFKNEGVTDVVTYGDTNTTIASAFAAKLIECDLYHVEAGLRSGNIEMIEEVNRIVADRISDVLYVPTKNCQDNLQKENSFNDVSVLSGNTISDVIYDFIKNKKIVRNTKKNSNVVLTLHRPELVNNEDLLLSVLNSINKLAEKNSYYINFVVHPRLKKVIKHNSIQTLKAFKIFDAMGYFEFLELVCTSHFVMTDSGGLQEEACILNIPCITLREETERPESVQCGANVLCSPEHANFENHLAELFKNIDTKKTWVSPYGDGNSAQIILDSIENFILKREKKIS